MPHVRRSMPQKAKSRKPRPNAIQRLVNNPKRLDAAFQELADELTKCEQITGADRMVTIGPVD